MKYYFEKFNVDNNNEGIQFIYDNWDDYGYKTLYAAYYISENKEIIELGSVSISTITEADDCYKNRNNKWVSYSSFEYLSKGINKDNIISLGNVEYYEKLYSTFSDTEVMTILEDLGDIAYNLELFEKNKELDVIHTSFLRGSTVNNLKQQLNRVAKKGRIQIPFDFKMKYSIENSLVTELSFKVIPESTLPTNVYSIIGNNGTGKTTFIQDIVKCYLKDKPVKSYLVDNSEAKLEIDNDGFESVLFVSFSAFDMLKNKYFSNLEKNYDISEANKKNFKYIGNSIFIKERQTVKNPEELAKDLIENIEEIRKSPDRIKLWEEEIVKLYFDNEISDFISKNLNEKEISVEKVAKLSSGQKMILLGLSALVSKINEKTLIIIDEPESYLHPPLVSAYIRILSDILSKKNGVAIIATHSPVILQEIPQKCVWVLERDKNKNLTVRNPRIETFGENISIIMDDVFGLDIRNTGFYQYLSQLSEQKEKAKNLLNNNKLGSEAELFLRIFLDGEE